MVCWWGMYASTHPCTGLNQNRVPSPPARDRFIVGVKVWRTVSRDELAGWKPVAMLRI